MAAKQMNTYDKNNPFYARILERTPLCKPGSLKNTHHIVLDLRGSNLSYDVGDCVALLPENDPEQVSLTLSVMKASGDEIIFDKRRQDTLSLRDFLTKRSNIAGVSRKFCQVLGVQVEEQKAFAETHHVWDALKERGGDRLSPQEVCDLLMPLSPRFYSIASSMKSVGDELHLTVALLNYDSNNQPRRGVCSHFLCTLAPLQEPVIPLYMHKHSGFTVPENDSSSMIMIGPGTGIAPYRGFMQERLVQNAAGKNWLFFGEWHRERNFFYEEFWLNLESEGKLKLDLAFSRDQEKKVYVQHKMLEKGDEFFKWIESGAYIFVCGDAKNMAKDVDAALHEIVQTHGRRSQEEAKEYVKALKAEKRYLRDVY